MRTSPEYIWEENISWSGKSQCKAIQVGLCLVGLRNYKEGHVAWAEYARRKVGGLIEVGTCHAGKAMGQCKSIRVYSKWRRHWWVSNRRRTWIQLSFERISLATELHTRCRRQAVAEPTSPVSESLQ